MASHFSDIGFHITEENFEYEIARIINENIGHAAQIDRGNGPDLVIPIDGGIELWFPFANNTINPYTVQLFYRTETFLEVENPSFFNEADSESAGLCSVALPDLYPINITVPAPGLSPEIQDKKTYNCQLACFAEDFSVYRDADDFHKNSPYGEDFSETMVIPSGAFVCQEPDSLYSSHALISGVVTQFEKKTNPFTKQDYYVILIDTFGGKYTLLADPELAPDGLQAGSIICGEFWLSGKLFPLFYGDELIAKTRKKEGDPHLRTLGDLYRILRQCWCAETAYPACQSDWSPADRTYGQCAVTAMLVHDLFGGSIHKIKVGGGTHYFNKIDGVYVDLTSEQFDLYQLQIDYEPNTEVDRRYCGKNPDTKKRYDLLVQRVSDCIRAL